MGLSLVGSQTDRSRIRDIVNKFLDNETNSTTVASLKQNDGNHTAQVDTKTRSFTTLETPTHNPQQSVSTNTQDLPDITPSHSTTTPASETTHGRTQRKRFRRSSPTSDIHDGTEHSLQDTLHLQDDTPTSQQQTPMDDAFDQHFPPLRTVYHSTSNNGSPPVIHIPDENQVKTNEYQHHLDSDNTSDTTDD